MKEKLHWNQLFIGIIVEVGSISVYQLIQQAAPGRYDLALPWDYSLPFWPAWIWIYISILPIFLYAALSLKPENFRITLRRVVLAHVITYPFFFIVPSDYPRPHSLDPATFYGWGYGVMHSIDGVNNTFPSLHVSITWVICHMLKRNGFPAWLVYGYAAIISLSTLLTKQHFILDVFGGFGIFLATLAIEPIIRQWLRKWIKPAKTF